MSKELTERNIKMYLDWRRGLNYRRIAIKYKKNYTTVSNIIKRYKAKVEQGLILKGQKNNQ